jgi:hypothetical protein
MFGSKIKLPADIYDRARLHAEKAGFASVDEFVARAVEKELERLSLEEDEEEARKRLEGLGYIS